MKKLSFVQIKNYKARTKILIIPIFLILVSMVLLIIGIYNLLTAGITIVIIISFLLGYLFFPLREQIEKKIEEAINPIYSKYENPLIKDRDSSQRGVDGEDIVFKWLDEIISNESWVRLPNEEFLSKNTSFDIDTILIGPKGIFIIEIKNYSYNLIFNNDKCDAVIGNKNLPCKGKDPRKEVSDYANFIENKLKKEGLGNLNTHRVVVFARKDSFNIIGKSKVYLVDNKESLEKYIFDTPDNPIFTNEFCQKIKSTILNK